MSRPDRARLGTRALTGALLAAGAAGFLVCETSGPAVADDSASKETRGSAFSLIDNSHADSWLEVDRTANSQVGSGTAGSDHDGGTEIRNSRSRVDSSGSHLKGTQVSNSHLRDSRTAGSQAKQKAGAGTPQVQESD